ncbi:MAG: TIR domain-containing protein [Alphaproteobacteria bacterium]
MFLSYARSSEEQATLVEHALQDAGYAVWRDTDLPAHLSYAEVIEERLKSAKAVLVLWSAEAAKSQWVRAEADAARELGTLVQSTVDGTVPPIPFNQIQCADLSGWTGEDNHPGWRKLKASVVALAGQAEGTAKSPRRHRQTTSICVLPFQNMSAEDVPDYFADGISEDITTDLAKLHALAVVPRKTAFKFKGQDVDPTEVAEKLSVAYVLEGAVRKAGDRVRITAQLIDGRTGDLAWSDRYYRDFTDVFAVQDEISKTIGEALVAELFPADSQPASVKAGKAAKPAKAGTLASATAAAEPDSAFRFEAKEGADAAEEPALEEPPAPVAEPVPEETPAPVEQDYAAEWNSPEEWEPEEEWDAEDDRPGRDYISAGPAPRIVALGIAALLIVGFVGFTFWPSQPEPVAEAPEEVLTYTITSSVYVRSLPTRKGSRVLGKLEAGDKINIVPTLAGAQPDWVKIKDGPYVGGYVWRESTRPVDSGQAGDAASEEAKGEAS